MARPREFDEAAVLDAAIMRFWQRGYEATSVRDLADEMNITRANLYNPFGDKRSLYVRPLNLEIPEAMQKKYGFAALGDAQGPDKTAIFSGNNARLYDIDPKKAMLELKGDRFAMMKAEYEKAGPEPSHTR
jgi:hypothetical protein